MSTTVALARWDTITQYVESAIVGESARWGDSLWDLGGQYDVRRTRDVDWRNNNAEIRSILQGNTKQLINAVKAAGFYVAQVPVRSPVSSPVRVPTPVVLPVAPPVAPPIVKPSPVSSPAAPPRTPPVVPPASSGMTLTLFNAVTDLPIAPLVNGSVINLATMGTSLNIVATPSPSTGVSSVLFTYDGALFRTENRAPYSLAADNELNGIIDYTSWTPKVGPHSLKATAYSSRDGAGTELSSLTIAFSVVASGATPVAPPATPPAALPRAPPVTPPVTRPVAPPVARPVSPPVAAPMAPPVVKPVPTPVASPVVPPVPLSGMTLTLYNAATDRAIATLSNGYAISLATVGSLLNIGATPLPATGVGSVRFMYDGNFIRNENKPPYSMAGDKYVNGTVDYFAWTPNIGMHTVTATAYSAANSTGTLLQSSTVSFSVV